MINILSYVGMSLQSEVCMWTLLGLIRTIFDATLFKVNANLKQVWQMNMPIDLPMSIQRIIRMVISGVMLVQCFTVYVYLASYIVLLYPVFLEERPALVLPWLLLAAVRKLLCELTSLALGLGICVLVGASKPPCIKFVIIKIISFVPSLYMWMLVLSYYHMLKVSAVYKTFSPVLPSSNHDYGLELAIRRRLTKSIFNEDMLRRKMISNYYDGRRYSSDVGINSKINLDEISPLLHTLDTKVDSNIQLLHPMSATSNRDNSEMGNFQDGLGTEVTTPRDTDRILEQFVLMLLRVSLYLKTEGGGTYKLFVQSSPENRSNYLDCTAMSHDDDDTSPHICSTGLATSSYLTDFPQIFQKKQIDTSQLQPNEKLHNKSQGEHTNSRSIRATYRSVSFSPKKEIYIEIEKSVSCKKIGDENKIKKLSDKEHSKYKKNTAKYKNNDNNTTDDYCELHKNLTRSNSSFKLEPSPKFSKGRILHAVLSKSSNETIESSNKETTTI